MTTARFNKLLPFIFEHENVYDKQGNVTYEMDKSDPGGTTKYGIDARSHPGVDIKNLTEEQATDIYFSEWTKTGCEALADNLGESHFDACVNCGVGRAKKFLTASDGDALEYNSQRIDFYHRLVAARPSSAKYLRGWLRRVSDLCKLLGIN